MDLQELVERLKEQHGEAWARVYGEIQVAYDEALAVLCARFPDPRQIPGVPSAGWCGRSCST